MKKMGGAMAMEKKRGRAQAQQQLYRTAKGGRTEKQHEQKAKLQLSRVVARQSRAAQLEPRYCSVFFSVLKLV
jgi:hypothetical protein